MCLGMILWVLWFAILQVTIVNPLSVFISIDMLFLGWDNFERINLIIPQTIPDRVMIKDTIDIISQIIGY